MRDVRLPPLADATVRDDADGFVTIGVTANGVEEVVFPARHDDEASRHGSTVATGAVSAQTMDAAEHPASVDRRAPGGGQEA